MNSLTSPPPVVSVSSAFDPGTLSDATLSNGNLTATRTSTSTGGAASTSYQSAGKYYFEFIVGASHGSTDFVGAMDASYGFFFCVNGNTGAGSGVWLGTGAITTNGGTVATLGAASASGNVIGVAIDCDNDWIWFRLNGGNWNADGTANPATNTGGVALIAASYAPAVAFSPYGSPTVGDNLTANLGATAFAYSVPFSFTAGWPP
ncbi:SPRY domain-containing protein [Bradyrhizobium sp. USDA 3256]